MLRNYNRLPFCKKRGCKSRVLSELPGVELCEICAAKAWAYIEERNGRPLIAEALEELKREALAKRAERKAKARAEGRGTIYYLRLDGTIKIGWTGNLEQRMAAYPPYAELLFTHPGTRAEERDLHRTFKPSRTHGREWYQPTPELTNHIDSLIRQRDEECQDRRIEQLQQIKLWDKQVRNESNGRRNAPDRPRARNRRPRPDTDKGAA